MKLQMPQKCPYCGKDFSFSRTSHFAKNKNGAIYFRIDELLCNHCGEISIAVSDIDFEEAHDAFIKVCVGIMFLLLHDKEQKIETPPHIDFN